MTDFEYDSMMQASYERAAFMLMRFWFEQWYVFWNPFSWMPMR